MSHILIETNDCGMILAPKDSVVLHDFNGHFRMLIVGEGEWRGLSEDEHERVYNFLCPSVPDWYRA